MNWHLSHRFDAGAVLLADRHYNRQTVGAPQFSPPGRLIVLRADGALWTTVAQQHVKHRWPGAWMNSLFRREFGALASLLIIEALAATRALWGNPPPHRADQLRRRRARPHEAGPGSVLPSRRLRSRRRNEERSSRFPDAGRALSACRVASRRAAFLGSC